MQLETVCNLHHKNFVNCVFFSKPNSVLRRHLYTIEISYAMQIVERFTLHLMGYIVFNKKISQNAL